MTTGINHITISVSDVSRSFAFYAGTLGLRPVARWSTGAYLLSGPTWVALAQEKGLSRAVRSDYSHIALSVHGRAFEAVAAALQSAGAVTWQQNKSEGESMYFLDPDGHKLEIHASDLGHRLEHMRAHPWDDITFFDTKPVLSHRVVHVCDVHDFRHVAVELGDRDVTFMDELYSQLSEIPVSRGAEIIGYFGDSILFLYGGEAHLEAVESALAMRTEYDRLLRRYDIRCESELENGISAGDVLVGTVGHPSHRVLRAFGRAVREASLLGCHRGVAVTAEVKQRIESRFVTRRIAELTVGWSDQPLAAWELADVARKD